MRHDQSAGEPASRGFRWALLAFAVAGTIGAALRLIYIVEIPGMLFRPWLHAHSHVAMLGWLFPGLLIGLCGQEQEGMPRRFWRLMALSQLLVLVMLIGFPLQGYGAVSITSSVLQVLVGYGLVRTVWLRVHDWPQHGSGLLARLALVFQVVSTLGIWTIGPVLAGGLAGSELYYWSIQWFLHFQFNGWFWFAVMAIGSRWAEKQGVDVRLDAPTVVLWATSAALTFALAIAWSERHWTVLAVNSIGVLLQLAAAWRTLVLLRRTRVQLRTSTSPWMRTLIGAALLSMAIKVMAQAAVAVPSVADMALTLRNHVIGFIHLNTLGAASSILLAFAVMRGWVNDHDRRVRIALSSFLLGFILSEALLFIQGSLFWAGLGMMPGYYEILFSASALLPIGLWILWYRSLRAEWADQRK
ncbi:MAG: hypothetical protein H6591_07190 [Flavobacteriales bacterium]|nr:hypothetical protein [Flavobacteriales bacterium]